MGAKRQECVYFELHGRKRERREDVGAMLPGKGVGVGRRVRAGFVLVLRFPRVQTTGRQRDSGRGASTGGSVAEEPDGHRFVQVCSAFRALTERVSGSSSGSC